MAKKHSKHAPTRSSHPAEHPPAQPAQAAQPVQAAQPTQPVQPAQGATGAQSPQVVHEVQFKLPTISLRFDQHFRRKAPLLAILFVLFLFSCVMFDKANLRSIDLVDLTRLDYSFQKLYSISFILFILLYSATLSFAMFYARKLDVGLALLVFPVTFVPALLLWVFMPSMYLVFIGFSLSLTAAAFFAARSKELDLSRAWTIAGRAGAVLLIGAVIIVFLKMGAAKEAYAGVLFSSAEVVMAQNPQLASLLGARGSLISEDMVRQVITPGRVADALTEDVVRDSLNDSSAFNALNASAQSAMVTQTHTALKSKAYRVLLEEGLEYAREASQQGTAGTSGLFRYHLENSELGKSIQENLPLILVPLVWVAASFAVFVIRILTTMAWFGLSRF